MLGGIIIGTCIGALGVMVWLFVTAERGWQDEETGYHSGEPDGFDNPDKWTRGQ